MNKLPVVYFFLFLGLAKCDWQLKWNDEFDGNSIDTSKWQFEVNCYGGGNAELQCYTARETNARVSNGNLILEAHYEPGYQGTYNGCTQSDACLGPKDYTSARLRTLGPDTGSWLYGKFEMRAKLPKGKHLWPAFWMLPTDQVYGTWAASGEIDIMEYRGLENNVVLGTLHYSSQWPNNRWTSSGEVSFPYDFSADFHVFTMEWEQDWIRWYVDGQKYFEQYLNKMWWAGAGNNPYTAPRQPWDQRFHMLLNLAIGGNFFNGRGTLSPSDLSSWTNPRYTVDYVRVYQWTDTPATSAHQTTVAYPPTSVSTNTPSEIDVSQDCFIKGGSSTNFGDSMNLEIKYSKKTSHNMETYLSFDLSSVSRPVTNATLALEVASISNDRTYEFNVGLVSATWDELSLNYNNRPASTFVKTARRPYSQSRVLIDVTDLVNTASNNVLSLRLYKESSPTTRLVFYSKESGQNKAPKIVFNDAAMGFQGEQLMVGNYTVGSESESDEDYELSSGSSIFYCFALFILCAVFAY